MDKEHVWFLDTLVTIHVAHADRDGSVSLLEHRARRGESPPLHVHLNEDEIFHVLDGELLIHRPDSTDATLGAGDAGLVPTGERHTYRVESQEARWLTITNGKDFENFVRAAARPPGAIELPPPSPPPSEEQVAELAPLSSSFGIELVGPPLH